MRIAIFFVYLFFLLLRMDDVHAATHLGPVGYAQAQPAEKAQAAIAIFPCRYCTIHRDNCADHGNRFFISDVVQDDDANNFFARKFKLLVSYYPTISYQSISNDRYNRTIAPPFFCGRVSYKYILQRVLRV